MIPFSSLRWLSRKPRTMEIQTNLHPLFHQEKKTVTGYFMKKWSIWRAEITQQLEQREKKGGRTEEAKDVLGKQCFLCLPNQLGHSFTKTGTLTIERPPWTKDLHASAESLLLQLGLWGSSSQVVYLMVGLFLCMKISWGICLKCGYLGCIPSYFLKFKDN